MTMCEIAVVPAVAQHAEDISQVGRVLYAENGHGFGAVAVHTDGEQFDYDYYKTVDPDWDHFTSWVASKDEAWRIVLHARLATAGEKTAQNAHPLLIRDCSETTIEAVVHNGVVRGHDRKRSDLEEQGHTFSTGVDSEVIAHAYGSLPRELDDDFDGPDFSIYGRLNYLLFEEDRILIANDGKYEVSEDFRMACGRRDWDFSADDTKGYTLFKPDGGSQFRRKKSIYQRGTGFWAGYTSQKKSSTSKSKSSQSRSRSKASGSGRRRGRDVGKTATGRSRSAHYPAGWGYCADHDEFYDVECELCIEEWEEEADSHLIPIDGAEDDTTQTRIHEQPLDEAESVRAHTSSGDGEPEAPGMQGAWYGCNDCTIGFFASDPEVCPVCESEDFEEDPHAVNRRASLR